MVASAGALAKRVQLRLVSIPFIAGQWSLRGARRASSQHRGSFQSPSLRGSGRFGQAPPKLSRGGPGLNPLHCGAVVASQRTSPPRFDGEVLIPFIAGQWSLHGLRPLRGRPGAGFNPLHCGAVVASDPGFGEVGAELRFNPLHCGAVVASGWHRAPPLLRARPVSIPFIAGQWSLLVWPPYNEPMATCFNPLHCGAVVASSPRSSTRCAGRCFNPLHCGAVVASVTTAKPNGLSEAGFNPLHCGAVVASRKYSITCPIMPKVSIPFIAGQWSLPEKDGDVRIRCGGFQSPSLRGSGRFKSRPIQTYDSPRFQSPSLRGSGRFAFLSGTSLRSNSRRFNPLHCGAVVASISCSLPTRGR